MTHDDATLTGLVTAGLLILASTLFAVNSATRVLGAAAATRKAAALGESATRVLGAATNAATTVLGGAATTATATGAAVAQDPNAQNVLGNLSQEDLEALIADNSPTLNREQVRWRRRATW